MIIFLNIYVSKNVKLMIILIITFMKLIGLLNITI